MSIIRIDASLFSAYMDFIPENMMNIGIIMQRIALGHTVNHGTGPQVVTVENYFIINNLAVSAAARNRH